MSRSGAPTTPDVSVVVPTVGRPVFSQCVAGIVAGSLRPVRLVVVDQADDAALHMMAATAIESAEAAGIECLHLRAPRRGAAAARNRGFAAVTTGFIAAVDDDCIVAGDWLEQLTAVLRRHPDDVVTGQVLPDDGGGAPSLITRPHAEVHTRPRLERDVLFTGNMGLATRVFWRVGGFDESPVLLHAAEDNEWAYRALRRGVAIRYDPAVRVVHRDWRDHRESAATERRYARGQGGFYGMYVRRGDVWMLRRLVRDVARAVRLAVAGAVGGDRRRAAAEVVRAGDLVRGAVVGITTRPAENGVQVAEVTRWRRRRARRRARSRR